MATSRNIILYIKGVSAARTHEEHVVDFMDKTKHKICKACDLTQGAYDEAHYDLAELWFRYHDYLEYTAKVFMVSRSYHRWWNQQLAQVEHEFLIKRANRQESVSHVRALLFEAIITMDVHPAAVLRRGMHEEGLAAIRTNPELLNLKIYRNEQ